MIMLSIFHLFACFWYIFFDEMFVPVFCPFFKWSYLSSYQVWNFLYILETSIFIRDLTFKYFCPICGNKDNFSPPKSHCCDSEMLLKLSPLRESKLSFLLKGHYNWANRRFLPPTYSEKRSEMADNYFFIFNFISWSENGIGHKITSFIFPSSIRLFVESFQVIITACFYVHIPMRLMLLEENAMPF